MFILMPLAGAEGKFKQDATQIRRFTWGKCAADA